MSDKFGDSPPETAFTDQVLFENTPQGVERIAAMCKAKGLTLEHDRICRDRAQVGCLKNLTVADEQVLYVDCSEW